MTTRPPRVEQERSPGFALVLCPSLDEITERNLLKALQAISESPHLVAPGLALADLRHTAHYFQSTDRLVQAALDALQQHCGSCPVTVVMGGHLLRAQIFLQKHRTPGLHLLGSSNINDRMLLPHLSWHDWLFGVCDFLSLYNHPQSRLCQLKKELEHFLSHLEAMRWTSPAQALASRSFSLDEIMRRFGPNVTSIWRLFCEPMPDWEFFLGRPLRRQEEPLNPQKFRTTSLELDCCAGNQVLALDQGAEILIATVQHCLEKIQQEPTNTSLGINHFSVTFEFGSGHAIHRTAALNEPIFELNRTNRVVLEHLAQGLCKKNKNEPQTNASLGATDPQPCLTKTREGLSIQDPQNPGVFYFLSHLSSVVVVPLRLSVRPASKDPGRIFDDAPRQEALHEITRLRQELKIQYGQDTCHLQETCDLTRPLATRPLPPPPAPTSPENLFMHTFSYRPPAVLRRPFPFRCPRPREQQPIYVETIGQRNFFVWTCPDGQSALWLCSDLEDTGNYVCLGFFDSLEHLPSWLLRYGTS